MLKWINIYKSGYWHTPGKLGTCDMHAGDCYNSRAEAEAAIERPDLYVTTVSVPIPEDASPRLLPVLWLPVDAGYDEWVLYRSITDDQYGRRCP